MEAANKQKRPRPKSDSHTANNNNNLAHRLESLEISLNTNRAMVEKLQDSVRQKSEEVKRLEGLLAKQNSQLKAPNRDANSHGETKTASKMNDAHESSGVKPSSKRSSSGSSTATVRSFSSSSSSAATVRPKMGVRESPGKPSWTDAESER